MSQASPRPSELLRRYTRNVYPPILGEENHAVVGDYLKEKGMEPVIGTVACGRQRTEYLARLATAEMSLKEGTAERAIVGPHSLGMDNAISLWAPANRSENLDGRPVSVS